MRHERARKRLGHGASHGRAILRNMVTSLFKHEQIETTDAKAKMLKPVAEKMITLAKRGDLHARRQALSYLKDKAVGHRLFGELKDRYLDRQGGYIRIVKKGVRKGDGAPMSVVQLIPEDEKVKKGKKKKKKAATKTGEKAKKTKKAETVKKEAVPKKEKKRDAPSKEKKTGKKTEQDE
jgi:large subunit ribosomal protein L17